MTIECFFTKKYGKYNKCTCEFVVVLCPYHKRRDMGLGTRDYPPSSTPKPSES